MVTMCFFCIWNARRSHPSVRRPKIKPLGPVDFLVGGVLAFLGLVISLICLLLERIYRTFLISILCNLFYDFAACLFMSCCYAICHTFIYFTKVYICSGMAYGTSSMGSWNLVCRMGCAGYTYLYSDNIYICYSFIGLYAKDCIFTLCLFSKFMIWPQGHTTKSKHLKLRGFTQTGGYFTSIFY
jgi:hypothetical protein